jgi:HEAT repeat protein
VSRRAVWVGFVVVGLAALAAGFSSCRAKPAYTSGGRTASYWAEILQQPDVEMRRKAAVKIGPLMFTDAAALPATLAALKDEDVKVRLAAIRSLKLYAGAKASQAIPALNELQANEKDLQVREAASKAVEVLAGR